MSNSNRMFDIRALGGFKSNDMSFEDFVRNVAKSGVSVGNAYMGKVSFAVGLPEAYTEGTMTVMILTGGLVKYIFNAPSIPYGEYECYSKDGGEPTEWSVGSGGGVADLMVETTYGELKSLRDSGGLVPGMQYRITDYECTTAMGSTRSANHQFDIIVTADTETVLNENARAINHSEHTLASGFEINYAINALTKISFTYNDKTIYDIISYSEEEQSGTYYHRLGLNKDFYTLSSEGTSPTHVYSFKNGLVYETIAVESVSNTPFEYLHTENTVMLLNGNTRIFDGVEYYEFEEYGLVTVTALKEFDSNGNPVYDSLTTGAQPMYSTVQNPSAEQIYGYNEDNQQMLRYIDLMDNEFKHLPFTDYTYTFDSIEREIPYDDYFAESSLKSWEIKYSLDNDANRFDWALDGIQPAPSLTAFLFWEDEEGEEYVYTHYEVNEEYIEWWEEVLNGTEEDEQVPRRGAKASGQHVFTGVNSQYDGGVYNASDLKTEVGKIKEMKVEEQPTKAFLTWWYKDDEGKQQYVTFYECKIDEKAGLIYWHNGDSSVYKECYTYAKLAVGSGKDYPETLVYSDGSFKTSIGYISQYSLPNSKKGTLDWKDGDTDRTYNSYYVYNNGSNKRVVAWTGEDISDKQEGDYGQNTVYTYCPPSDYSETDPQESGYVYSSDSLDDRTRLRGPADIGTINDFDMPVIPAEDTRGVVLRETAESEPTYITGKGVIYYMKDEYGNEAPYDFKNIQYVISEKVSYTFNVWNDALQGYDDDSTVGYGECYGNIIKIYKSTENKQALNFIIHGEKCTLNTFECNCHSNNIGDSCHSNTFKENCSKNSMSSKCIFNTFEKGFANNSINEGTTYVHAFEYVNNCIIAGNYIQIYPYTHDIELKENSDYPKFVGNSVNEEDVQIAEYWPYRIKYAKVDITDNKPIIEPKNTTIYQCSNSLIGLSINYSSINMMNFKVEFTAGADFTISLPSNSRYIGSLDCESGKTYLLTHDDEGMYYIGGLNTSI